MTWWSRLELDSRTVLMMLKGALIPTLVIAMYRAISTMYRCLLLKLVPDIKLMPYLISPLLLATYPP